MPIFWCPRSMYQLRTIHHNRSWLQCNQGKHAEIQFYTKYSIIPWD